ncbi:unnamed protein product [Arctogadus glacialis]
MDMTSRRYVQRANWREETLAFTRGLKARMKSQRGEEAAVAGVKLMRSELYCLADIPGLNPHSNLGGRLFSLNGNTALGSPLTAQQETGSLVPDTPAKAIEPGIRDAGPSRNEENKNKYFH